MNRPLSSRWGQWLDSKDAWTVVLIFCAVFAIYLPVVQGNYLYHDDYYLMAVGPGGECFQHPQYPAYLYDYYRPVGIHIKCLYSHMFSEPRGANVARGLTLLAIGAVGWFVHGLLKRLSAPAVPAILTAILVVTLPPFQTAAAMIANATHVYGMLLGMAGGCVALKAVGDQLEIQDSGGAYSASRKAWLLLGSMILFLIAAATYQLSAYAFLFPLMLATVFSRAPVRRLIRALVVAGSALVAGSILYFIATRILRAAGAGILEHPSNRGEISFDLGSKIEWVMHELLPRSFAFWSIEPSLILTSVAVMTGLIVATLYVLLGGEGWRGIPGRERFQGAGERMIRLLLVTVMLLGTMAPQLVIAKPEFFYRTLISFQPGLVLWVFSLSVAIILGTRVRMNVSTGAEPRTVLIRGGLSLVLLAGVAVGGFMAHESVLNRYVLPQTLELNWLKNQVASKKFRSGDHVHIVRPRTFLVGRTFKDEFGPMTTVFAQDIPFVMMAVTRQIPGWDPSVQLKISSGPDAKNYDFPVDWPLNRKLPVPARAHVIDMNKIGLAFD